MRDLRVDAVRGTASFKAASTFYSKQSVAIAAHVFESRAAVSSKAAGKFFELTLRSKRKGASDAELSDLAGEFLNELLNQEYRLVVGRFNAGIAQVIVTQALYCAGGGDFVPRSGSGESTREFKAGVEGLMKAARAEVLATMPKKVRA